MTSSSSLRMDCCGSVSEQHSLSCSVSIVGCSDSKEVDSNAGENEAECVTERSFSTECEPEVCITYVTGMNVQWTDPEQVIIPSSVSEILDESFMNVCSLRSVTFEEPCQVKRIGISAFAETGLEKVIVPRSVAVIEEMCFSWCEKLKSVEFESGSELKEICFMAFGTSGLEVIVIPWSVEKIGKCAFAVCESLREVEFESGSQLKVISAHTFSECSNLKEFHCPSSVSEIDWSAFSGCRSLVKFVLEKDSLLRKIGKCAFKDCSVREFVITKDLLIDECDFTGIVSFGENYVLQSGLLMSSDKKSIFRVLPGNESVCIPASVECIRIGAFPSELKQVSFEEGTKLSPVYWYFQSCSIDKLVLPSSFEDIMGIPGDCVGKIEFEIGNPNFECFDDFIVSTDSRILWRVLGECKEVTVPCYIEKIGKRCFANSHVEKVLFEEGSELRELGEEAFYRSSLASITLPDSLETIKEKCFANTKNLTEIELPGSLVRVGNEIFNESGVESVSFCSSKLDTLSWQMFDDSSLIQIIIPQSVTKIEYFCFSNCRSLVEVSFESGSRIKKLENGCFRGCSSLESFCIPRGVLVIDEGCFDGCGNLRSVSFEEGSDLTTLGKKCFYKTAIERICLPKSVTVIESGCFSSCENLIEFRFEDGAVIKELGDIFGKTSRVKAFVPKSVESLTPSFISSIYDLEFEPGSPFSVSESCVFNMEGEFIGSFGDIVSDDTTLDSELVIGPETELNTGMFGGDAIIKSVRFDPEWRGTSLCENMFYQSLIEKIVIPKCVTVIEEKCFYKCKKLKVVEFESESELRNIRSEAFSRAGFEKIVIPRSVEEIGKSAFYWCKDLKEVEFENESQLKVIGKNGFRSTSLTMVSVPDSVTDIGDGCFCETPLTECRIGDNSQLQIIGENVFKQLPHLFIPSKVVNLSGTSLKGVERVTVSPENPHFCVCGDFVMSADQTSLYGLSKPVDCVVVPKSVRVMKKGCFRGRKCITSVTFEEGSELEVVESGTCNDTSLTRIEFPRMLRKLGEEFGCETLREISFHDDCPLEEIPKFKWGIENLILHIPSNVSKINRYVPEVLKEVSVSANNQYFVVSSQFLYSRSGELIGCIGCLKYVIIPKEVTVITAECFQNRTCRDRDNITTVAFEEGSMLTKIEQEAFCGQPKLETISFENVCYLTEIGERAFFYCTFLSIEIPNSVQIIGANAFREVPNVSVESGSRFSLSDGMIMNAQETDILGFYGKCDRSVFILPKHIKCIADKCFEQYECVKFTFEEGSTLETIGEKVFSCSDFTEIEIPSSVVTIGSECFFACQVEKIHFGATSNLTVFEEGLFVGSRIKNIVIPASVTELGIDCFSDAKELVSVSFDGSSSLICIRNRCFSGCERLELFEFEKCPNLRYIHEEAFCETALWNVELHPRFEFVSESAFDEECKITVIDDIEDISLSEWAMERDGDFWRPRDDDFYLGSDFVKTKLLGSGSFGKVYLVVNRFTGEKFAVKEMNEGLTKQEQFVREIELIKSLTHPCIVALKGFQLSPVMSMCMGYASGGTLEDALSSSPSWFDPTCKLIAVIGIASAMSHIHSHNVIHRDLKPSNILLNRYHRVKISDFGTARFDSNTCTMNLGTPLYMAPEMLKGDTLITRKVDVFSFGLILYQIIECVSVSSLKEQYPDVNFSSLTNKAARSLIEACLDPNPKNRPEFDEILEEIKNFDLELIEGADTEKARKHFERLVSSVK